MTLVETRPSGCLPPMGESNGSQLNLLARQGGDQTTKQGSSEIAACPRPERTHYTLRTLSMPHTSTGGLRHCAVKHRMPTGKGMSPVTESGDRTSHGLLPRTVAIVNAREFAVNSQAQPGTGWDDEVRKPQAQW